ncbi:hypothetical protein, partial [Acinetobacter baumannii]|uniref:hypothetical protein n=1 Tax=Acinetobacter baumannii TaxID=470 RepID=UPI00129E1CB2
MIQPRSYAAVPVEGGTVAPASVHPVQTVQPIEESKPVEKPKSQKTQVEEKHGTGNLQQGTSGSNSSTHVNGSSSEAVPLK